MEENEFENVIFQMTAIYLSFNMLNDFKSD